MSVPEAGRGETEQIEGVSLHQQGKIPQNKFAAKNLK
jgi:hypothetical protein